MVGVDVLLAQPVAALECCPVGFVRRGEAAAGAAHPLRLLALLDGEGGHGQILVPVAIAVGVGFAGQQRIPIGHGGLKLIVGAAVGVGHGHGA